MSNERSFTATMKLLGEVVDELRLRGATELEAVNDMGGEYIVFSLFNRTWAAAYGENCQLTGGPEDQWGGNTYAEDDQFAYDQPGGPKFLAFHTGLSHVSEDADVIATALVASIRRAVTADATC